MGVLKDMKNMMIWNIIGLMMNCVLLCKVYEVF